MRSMWLPTTGIGSETSDSDGKIARCCNPGTNIRRWWGQRYGPQTGRTADSLSNQLVAWGRPPLFDQSTAELLQIVDGLTSQLPRQ